MTWPSVRDPPRPLIELLSSARLADFNEASIELIGQTYLSTRLFPCVFFLHTHTHTISSLRPIRERESLLKTIPFHDGGRGGEAITFSNSSSRSGRDWKKAMESRGMQFSIRREHFENMTVNQSNGSFFQVAHGIHPDTRRRELGKIENRTPLDYRTNN